MWRTKEAYKQKPFWAAMNGFSSIREEFIKEVFGSIDAYEKLTSDDGLDKRSGGMNISNKAYWILARFFEIGTIFNNGHEFRQRFEFLTGLEDTAVAMGNMYMAGKDRYGSFQNVGEKGKLRYMGLPAHVYDQLKTNGMPVDPSWMIGGRPKFIVKDEPETTIIEESPNVKFEDIIDRPVPIIPKAEPIIQNPGADTAATIELLLEAMANQQKIVSDLKTMIETRVPQIISHEIRGITRLVDGIFPKLQGLNPDQIQKVDQLLDLFLGMPTMKG